MIPKKYILEWRGQAPWPSNAQVEQDLLIETALIRLFSDPFLKEHLAFRGGTALHKFFLKPQVRYSEDIDLVQVKEGSIGEVLNVVRKQMSFIGTKAKYKRNVSMNTLKYRFESEIAPKINLSLKIEINCREHFSVFGYQNIKHNIENGYFSGSCFVKSYLLEELLGTKLRALFQRRKGRDLFDLYHALTNAEVDTDKLIEAFKAYMMFSVNQVPSKKIFIENMDKKMLDPDFSGDIYALLRPAVNYDQKIAYELIKERIIEKL